MILPAAGQGGVSYEIWFGSIMGFRHCVWGTLTVYPGSPCHTDNLRFPSKLCEPASVRAKRDNNNKRHLR